MAEPWRPRAEGAVRLADGRQLSYAEWGDPEAPPVLFFHGALGSRFSGFDDAVCQAAGVRTLSVERPGFGLSDPAPGRSLLDWPADMTELADRLGMERFAVLGIAAGGPYALACAVRLPSRLSGTGVVAGALPAHLYGPDDLRDLAERDVDAARARIRAEMTSRAADVEGSIAGLGQQGGSDGEAYGQPTVQSRFVASSREAFRQGVDGPTDDHLLLHLPWGFGLDEVVAPVRWWVGGQDDQNPAALLEPVRGSIARLDLTVYAGEGHAIALTHGEEILASLVP